ncbi:MAG: hypothetical protein M1830_000160 [Pleopsidium flavum]|nr:MAG: hypothetical protein M1830_000160 [Pleopsidium flavum]
MSMVSPLDFSVRPEDKAFNFFPQPLEDPFDDLFDQYINYDPFESSQSNNASSASGDLEFSFVAGNSSSGSEPTGTSPTVGLDARHAQSHQPWRTTLWPNQQNVASSSQGYQTFIQHKPTDEAVLYDTELLSLKGISRPTVASRPAPSSLPSTPPSTPSRKKTKSATTTPKAIRRRDLDARKGSIRNSSVSPKIMRPSHYHRVEMPSYHEWTQRFENFNLEVPAENLPMSPPPSTKVSQEEKLTRLIVPAETTKQEFAEQQGFEDVVSPLQRFSIPSGSVTGSMPIPAAQMPNIHRAALQRRTTTDGIGYPTAMYSQIDLQSPQPQSQRQASWMPTSTRPSDFGFDTSSDFQSQDWWTTSATQPSHPYYQTATTSNRQASHSLAQLSSDSFASQGLMISCDPVTALDPFVAEDPSIDYFTASSDLFNPLATGAYSPTVSPSTSRQRYRTPPSRSPSASPSAITPTKTRRTSRPSNRRKSCTTTPKTPTSVGFVNFTPSDSKKILTGVAPSGSSKTKARREKEAIEKRRRLSQAAVRAIKEAGGDLEALQAEGLLI